MPDQPPIVIASRRLERSELARLAQATFGSMVKLVVDVRRRVVAIGGELHADGEGLLLEDGSEQRDLWGANYYPGRGADQCVEFTALINIRPSQNNPAMEIADPAIRQQVRAIIGDCVGNGESL